MPEVPGPSTPSEGVQAKCVACGTYHPLDYFIKWGNRERQVRSLRCRQCFKQGLKAGNTFLMQTFAAGLTRDEAAGKVPFNPAIIP